MPPPLGEPPRAPARVPAPTTAASPPTTWREWWNRPHSVYVSQRHLRVHYAHVADAIIASLPPARPLAVLDYGCGEALEAPRVAAAAGSLILYDAAPRVRAGLAARCGAVPGIAIADEAALAALGAATLDVVVVYSVIQYLTRGEFAALLDSCARWLRPGGLLLLVDVVRPGAGVRHDVAALLRTAWRHGFLGAALRGLASTMVSPYRRLRRERGLTAYGWDEMRGLLDRAGFDAERRARNLHLNPARMTILARRR